MVHASSNARAEKPRFPREVALGVTRELLTALRPCCERLIVAGSLRRRKPDVGDVEIIYIPRIGSGADMELFESPKNLADRLIEELLGRFILRKRTNVRGAEMFGAQNKLVQHVLSGVPVDLFCATPANWFNYLVCRTGGAESNTRIALEARLRGYKWNPYGEGFTRLADGKVFAMESEEDVFRFVGLPFLPPCERR